MQPTSGNSEFFYPTNIGSRKHAVFTAPTAIRPPVAAEGRFKVLLPIHDRNSNPGTNLSTADVVELFEPEVPIALPGVSVCAACVSL